jgi:hypothetical protein
MQALLMVPGLLHARFAVYPQVLGALPTAALLAGIAPVMERLPVPALRLPAHAAAIALVVVSPLIAAGLAGKAEAPAEAAAGNCAVRAAAPALDDPGFMGGSNLILLTHPDQAPEVLYWTGHRVVAGLYHLNVDGLTDAVAVATARDDAKAREILQRRGVAYVLVCAAQPPPGARRDEAQLFHRLERGQAPDWLKLQPWPGPIGSDLRLYRVRP